MVSSGTSRRTYWSGYRAGAPTVAPGWGWAWRSRKLAFGGIKLYFCLPHQEPVAVANQLLLHGCAGTSLFQSTTLIRYPKEEGGSQFGCASFMVTPDNVTPAPTSDFKSGMELSGCRAAISRS